jgi:dTMP kinase
VTARTSGRGRFIAFEGGEGCGKSTQAARLATRLDARLTREPGGTVAGGSIRALLLDPATGDLDPRAEALLMAADRAQHVAEVVRPTLDAGRDVVTDRYAGSSLAYQGFGRGLRVDEVRWLSDWAGGGLWPDLNVLIDVPDSVAAGRLGHELDRIEGAGNEFHARVLEGFRTLAADAPEHWAVIDGDADPDVVEERVWSAIMSTWPDAPA